MGALRWINLEEPDTIATPVLRARIGPAKSYRSHRSYPDQLGQMIDLEQAGQWFRHVQLPPIRALVHSARRAIEQKTDAE